MMSVWRKENIEKMSLCYSSVYYYNGGQRYEQFLQVGRLYRALILLDLALCVWSSWCCILNFFVTLVALPLSELSLVGLALDLVN